MRQRQEPEHTTPTVTTRSSPPRLPLHHAWNAEQNNTLAEEEIIDIEGLKQVFGSEDLSRHKPHELRELWMQRNDSKGLPRFLLDPKDEGHVAPHVMALQLLMGKYPRFGKHHHPNNGEGLYCRVRTDVDDEQDSNRLLTSSPIPRIFLVPLTVIAVTTATCQFVLEVLGGAGAIWGTAELFGLRKGGPLDVSWSLCRWIALGVGLACLLRFGLLNGFRTVSFVQLHQRVLRKGIAAENQLAFFLELAQIVAKDPFLFLHPTKGPLLSSFCGCSCVCCGILCCSLAAEEPSPEDYNPGLTHASPSHKPSMTPSPQRATWSLSSEEDDYDGLTSSP